MPFNIGPGELILILLLALIVLGPGKLPEVGSALGRAIREFRQAASDVSEATRGEPTGHGATSPAPAGGPSGSGAGSAPSAGGSSPTGGDGGASGSERSGQTGS